MQISGNATGLCAGLSVVPDSDARDHCVVAVKGTFIADQWGQLQLAATQVPLLQTDEYYGDPALTAVRYECDFARIKPKTDVVVVGQAVAMGGKQVDELRVRLEVRDRVKELAVIGDRRWTRSLRSVSATAPVKFSKMPITYDRAWGGSNALGAGSDSGAVELRNPVGCGIYINADSTQLEGRPLPNIEHIGQRTTHPKGPYEPAGFGCIGRGWQPRISLAGTYDESWRAERAPYLPHDFDDRYFQCAPVDQQFDRLRSGERLRCVNMAETPIVDYIVPGLSIDVRFVFVSDHIDVPAELDTITLEPHVARAMLVWRASVPLPKKLTALRQIYIEDLSARSNPGSRRYKNGKPQFDRLGDAVRWLRQMQRKAAR